MKNDVDDLQNATLGKLPDSLPSMDVGAAQSPGRGLQFVFCSLSDGKGCTGIAMFTGDKNSYSYFGTSHTEQGANTLAQIWAATIATNKVWALKDAQKNSAFLRNWLTDTDYIAGVADGSVTPYKKFDDGTIAKIKINTPPHGSSEPEAKTYNPGEIPIHICIEKLEQIPTNGEPIDAIAFSKMGGDRYDFKNFDELNSLFSDPPAADIRVLDAPFNGYFPLSNKKCD